MKKIASVLLIASMVFGLCSGVTISSEAVQKDRTSRIKVGIVDSGIDYTPNCRVTKSRNFVENYTDKNILFSDLSGHGTAVAGVVAEINPDALIYSAEVLDEESTSTVDRLVEGIDWLIREKVHIINISCGMNRDSDKLHAVIKKAYDAGILLVAAAGEKDELTYPACYPEVMAVGAVDKNGRWMDGSPKGPAVEAVAPGVDIVSVNFLGVAFRVSGTSMAAPYITATASKLWQKDPEKSAGAIRSQICKMAACPDEQEKSEMSRPSGGSSASSEGLPSETSGPVKGLWTLMDHDNLVLINSEVMKNGAIWPDAEESSIAGMVLHPQFHGFYTANYIDSCIEITKVAAYMGKKGKFPKANTQLKKDLMRAAKKGFKKYTIIEKKSKALFIYAMALHTAADIFAHSTTGVPGKDRKALYKSPVPKLVKKWERLNHGPLDPKTGYFSPLTNMADDFVCIPRRFREEARTVCKWIITNAAVKERAATREMFSGVKWYKTISEAQKYGKTPSDIKKKKSYLIQSFGILNLSKYMHFGVSSKVNQVILNMEAKNIKGVIKKWEKG